MCTLENPFQRRQLLASECGPIASWLFRGVHHTTIVAVVVVVGLQLVIAWIALIWSLNPRKKEENKETLNFSMICWMALIKLD